MRRGRIERNSRAHVAVVMERAHALERASHQSLVVERFCNGRRRLCYDWGRRRDFGLDRRRRRSACRQHLFQIFEGRRENALRRDHRLSFAGFFVAVVVSADVLFLFRHRRGRRALGSTTDYAADTTRFKLCTTPQRLRRDAIGGIGIKQGSMQSDTFRSLIAPMERIRWAIWLAVVGPLPIFVAVAYAQFGRSEPAAPLPSISLTMPLVILSVVLALLAPYMPRILLPDSRLRKLIEQSPEEMARDPRTRSVDADRLARIKALPPDEKRLLVIVSNLFAGFTARVAFNETIGVIGLVLAFNSRSFAVLLPFVVASLALNLMLPSLLNMALQRAAILGLETGNTPIQPQ